MEPRQNLRTRSEAAFAAFLQGEELWYRAVRDFPDNRGDNACDIEAGTVVSGQQEQSGSVASSPRAGSEASSELGYSPSHCWALPRSDYGTRFFHEVSSRTWESACRV